AMLIEPSTMNKRSSLVTSRRSCETAASTVPLPPVPPVASIGRPASPSSVPAVPPVETPPLPVKSPPLPPTAEPPPVPVQPPVAPEPPLPEEPPTALAPPVPAPAAPPVSCPSSYELPLHALTPTAERATQAPKNVPHQCPCLMSPSCGGVRKSITRRGARSRG